jgi:hypothetical protein
MVNSFILYLHSQISKFKSSINYLFMNKYTNLFYTFLIVLFIDGFNTSAYSQISYGGKPVSFTDKNLPATYEIRELQKPDLDKLRAEDYERAEKDLLYRYGTGIDANFDMENSGTWFDLGDGGRIWRLKIKVINALAIGIYYDNFYLPEGSRLYLYNEDKTQVLGAYTSDNNPPSGIFANELVQGESVNIEYIEPSGLKDKAVISISQVCYAYRAVSFPFLKTKTQEYNSSDYCEVDVNCSEGNLWQNQKRGVVRISVKAGATYGWCSGSLVNNTTLNCLPYILTADHCAEGYSDEDLLSWIFYFNYERLSCNNENETEPVPATITGSAFKANGGWSGSDFFLVLLQKYVPTTINPFFNGWRSTNVGSPSGVGIHHPAGDVKKISTYTQSLTNSYTTHWSVKWATTTNGHGVTEGGSSGSPIFNNEGLVVGTLTGGLSACVANGAGPGTGPDKNDVYGKFSYSWASNGSNAYNRLKNWLAPDGTNPATLQGKNADCTVFPPVADFLPSATVVTAGSNVHFTNLTLTSSESGTSTTYLWEFEGVEGSPTSMVNNPNRVYNMNGTFPVTLTATSNTGQSSSKTKYITVTGLGIGDVSGSPLTVCPNPSDGIVNINFGSDPDNETAVIHVYNSIGKEILNTKNTGIQVLQLDMTQYPSGIYFINVDNGKKLITNKISIVR